LADLQISLTWASKFKLESRVTPRILVGEKKVIGEPGTVRPEPREAEADMRPSRVPINRASDFFGFN